MSGVADEIESELAVFSTKCLNFTSSAYRLPARRPVASVEPVLGFVMSHLELLQVPGLNLRTMQHHRLAAVNIAGIFWVSELLLWHL